MSRIIYYLKLKAIGFILPLTGLKDTMLLLQICIILLLILSNMPTKIMISSSSSSLETEATFLQEMISPIFRIKRLPVLDLWLKYPE